MRTAATTFRFPRILRSWRRRSAPRLQAALTHHAADRWAWWRFPGTSSTHWATAVGIDLLSVGQLVRPNGDLDASFGTGGTTTTDFARHEDRAQALVLQGGRPVAVGSAVNRVRQADLRPGRYLS